MADSKASGAPKKEEKTLTATLQKAGRSAARGGLSGAAAQSVNVFTMMWMRTIMNYQYRYGGDMVPTMKKLYAEGGVPRFYRGLAPALIQAPFSRFFDTAANDGALTLTEDSSLPTWAKTACGSFSAGVARVFLMPVDAWKTTKQVEGAEGLKKLMEKTKKSWTAPFQGSVGAMTSTWVGHYPWFYTNNQLKQSLPEFDFWMGKHVRYAVIGFCSAAVSDCLSNSLRVLKTTRQTATVTMSYKECLTEILAKDGWQGLFGRGLKTRIIANGVSGALFTVGWKAFSELFEKWGL